MWTIVSSRTRQIERITYLVNDILDFTRGASSTMALLPMDYAAYIGSLLQEFQPEVESRKVALQCESDAPNVKVPMNPKRLSRVFHNLIGNAVDAMPQGGKIRLAFSTTSGAVVTEIRDSGPGIQPEILDKLFDPFVTYGKVRGTGLGLSICRRIIEEHGGKISAGNHPNGGAVFRFSLPTHSARVA